MVELYSFKKKCSVDILKDQSAEQNAGNLIILLLQATATGSMQTPVYKKPTLTVAKS